MSNFKKYFLPTILIVLVIGLLLWSTVSDKAETVQKPQTASEKKEQTTKVESPEITSQSENYQLSSPETKSQPKVQGSNTQKPNPPAQTSNSSTNEAGIPVKEVSLKIEAGNKGTYTYQIPWESNDNVWTVLQRASGLKHFSIETDDQWLPRIFVSDIYDTNINQWEFKVNDKCSNVAANYYPVQEDDSIFWSNNKICSP